PTRHLPCALVYL
ncbi:hypothetical protein CP99DC5_1051B, partial [Chlamydia psittaci 99DC5]